LNIPVLVTLQGDDVFLDSLKSPYREQCLAEIKKLVQHVDGFIVHSQFFRDYMSRYFEIDPAKIHVTPLGIDVQDYVPLLKENRATTQNWNQNRVIGYLARLAPEKGLHQLAEAFFRIKHWVDCADVKLIIAGWLGPPHLKYAEDVWRQLNSVGLENQYQYIGSIDRPQKLQFLSEIDILCVPTVYQEPKGLYALEALAAGVPIVVPNHGAFPEIIEASQGGRLFEAGNMDSLVDVLCELLNDAQLRTMLGQAGQQFVHQQRNASSMARSTGEVIRQFLG
jgi:glycosyltransferase involved in cell wall biosynthesis